MAKTLFVVDDDLFGALPEAVQKSLLGELKKLFSFISGFTVDARKPDLFPATLHFTDSIVKLVQSDDEVEGAITDMRRQEDANIRFSATQKGSRFNLAPFSPSFGGNPDRGGMAGHVKQVFSDAAGQTVSLTMTFGGVSLESAEQAVVDEVLHGRTVEDIRNERQRKIAKMNAKSETGIGGLAYYMKHEALVSIREEMEAELAIKHTPLKDWPTDQVDWVAKALARMVAHEARHQYILAHSTKGLGADSPRIWGDKNFEQFDGADKANIIARINLLNTQWDSASIHLETSPQGKPSPFA